MRGFILLVRRDLAQRVPLFVASLAMGLFIAAIPLLRGSQPSPAEIRGAAGLTAALSWCAVLAILLGGSIFTRDLTEHRLAFDFRLPVRPSAIWAARLLAAIVTIALAAALVLAPSALVGMDLAGAAAGLDEMIGHGIHGTLAYVPLAILALLLLANPIALASRTRTAWAGVDMLSVAVVGLAAFWTLAMLNRWEADIAFRWSCAALVLFCGLGATCASWLMLGRGRTEVDKAHKASSVGMFATALATAGILVGATTWILRPTTSQILGSSASARGLGTDWIQLVGPTMFASDVSFRFLVNPNHNRTIRLGPYSGKMVGGDAKLSFDGSTIGWLETDSSTLNFSRLHTLEALSPIAVPTATQVVMPARIGSWALSPDGKDVAVMEYTGGVKAPQRLVVSSVASGAVKAARMVPACVYRADIAFVSTRQLLIPCSELRTDSDVSESVSTLDLETSQLVPLDFRPRSPASFESGFRLFKGRSSWLRFEEIDTSGDSQGWRLLDPDGTRPEATVRLPATAFRYSGPPIGRQLHDGKFAIAIRTRDGSSILVFDTGGALERSIDVPLEGTTTVLAELAQPQTLLIATLPFPWRSLKEWWSVSLVDLSSGRHELVATAIRLSDWRDLGASRSVMRDQDGRFLWFNPHTRAIQPVLSESQ